MLLHERMIFLCFNLWNIWIFFGRGGMVYLE